MKVFFLLVVALVLCAAQNAPAPDGTEWIELRQADFSKGTYMIRTPGYYRLMESIYFNPKAPPPGAPAYDYYRMEASDFQSGGGIYDLDRYSIGFWAAITIETSGVTIDLNGQTIGQHRGHNLMNRFFNVIELGNQPFYGTQGFHNFGGTNLTALESANDVTIQNGVIGLSAGCGIHGVNNKNIYIQGVTFNGFENCAISLAGVQTAFILDTNIIGNGDVRINSLWRTAVMMRPYIDALFEKSPATALFVQGAGIAIETLRTEFRNAINNVYIRLIDQEWVLDYTPEWQALADLFGNDFRVPDSNLYGIIISDFNKDGSGKLLPNPTDKFTPSKNITISNVHLSNMVAAPQEVVGLTGVRSQGAGGVTLRYPITDARGNVFSVLALDWDYTQQLTPEYLNATWTTVSVTEYGYLGSAIYKGNLVSNIQAIVGQAILDGIITKANGNQLDTVHNTFNRDILKWIAADPSLPEARLENYMKIGTPTFNDERHFICNSDNQGGALYGVTGIQITTSQYVLIQGSSIYGLTNYGNRGMGVCLYDESSTSNMYAAFPGFGGASAKGFLFVDTKDVEVNWNYLRGLSSNYGTVIAWDLVGYTQFVTFYGNELREGWAGRRAEGTVSYENNPTAFPSSIGFHTTTTTTNITLDLYCVNGLWAPSGFTYKTSIAENTEDRGEWDSCHAGEYPWWIWFLLAIVSLIFLMSIIAVIMSCLDANKEPEGEHYTQMND